MISMPLLQSINDNLTFVNNWRKTVRMQVAVILSIVLAVFTGSSVYAQETEQCYAPLPALQLESIKSGDSEFGLQGASALESYFPPGKTILRTRDFAIGADEMLYQPQQGGLIEASGGVRVVGDDYQIDGEFVKAIEDEEYFEITEAEFGLYQIDENNPSTRYKRARGTAAGVRIQGDLLFLESSEFTHCPEGNDDIYLSASEITLNTTTRQGVARNTKVKFKGQTILAVPYLRFPIGSERLTGFLFPTLSASSKLGTGLTVPYYINIAPNRDATLTPKFYSKRGLQLETEYRQLGVYSDLRFVGEYMPRDKRYYVPAKPVEEGMVAKEDAPEQVLDRSRRYGAELTGNLHDGGSFYSNFDLSWVSDRSFLDNYSGQFSDQDRDYLRQNMSVSYAEHGLVVSAGVNKFIASSAPVENKSEIKITDGSANDDNEDHQPYNLYNREPWFSIDFVAPLAPNVAFSTTLSWDKFKKRVMLDEEDGVPPNVLTSANEIESAKRFRGEAAFSINLANAFSEVDLEIGGEYLRHQYKYKLPKPVPTKAERLSVNSTYASLDGRLYFDRYSADGSGQLWTLVPRVKVLATNDVKKEQEDFRKFDTTMAKMDAYYRLFQDSPYIGGDRLRETDQISVGISAHYSDPSNSSLTGSVGVGRVFYPDGHTKCMADPEEMEKSKVNCDGKIMELPNGSNGETKPKVIKKSDMFFEAKLQNSSTEFGYSALFSTETHKISSSSMRLSQAITDDAELTSIFRHQRQGESQWGNALSFNLDSNWTTKMQVIRTLDPDQTEQASLSFDYSSCCTRIGLMIERERETDGTYDNSFSLIFDLTPRQ